MSDKRYIITCTACGGVTEVTRRNAWTCSTRCRVWLHRHPEVMRELRTKAQTIHAEPFLLLEVWAVKALRPDLAEAMMRRERDLPDVRDDVVHAYREKVCAIFKALRDEEAAAAAA